ncbi:conserved protein of unknown function [Denitratisoma oestradiolicum]|uniref:Uncharacterized protein n=1 Tax=Denitratisoma oestradiolicum TaxID=311182 RepID=A0A6S6XSM6_9PROT|nr:conserved protein of unknown function [Denitratisoma oestradiolicum]
MNSTVPPQQPCAGNTGALISCPRPRGGGQGVGSSFPKGLRQRNPRPRGGGQGVGSSFPKGLRQRNPRPRGGGQGVGSISGQNRPI